MKIDNSKIEDIYPLSPMQQGMLFHSLLDSEKGVYIEQFCCNLNGKLDIELFKKAWIKTIQLNQVLRSAFITKKIKEPVQVVYREADLPFEVIDLTTKTSSFKKMFVDEIKNEEKLLGFDFSKAPLMRFKLLLTDPDSYVFIWTYHHILLDGWSMPLVMQDVFYNYECLLKNLPAENKKRRPFRDYISWIRKQDNQSAEKFWRKRLIGFIEPTKLPYESEIIEAFDDDPSETEIVFDETLTQKISSFAAQNRITVNTVVQSAWALLLSIYSNSDDVLFGATVSGRPISIDGAEEMIGLFINTLPVRIRIDSQSSVSNWLREIQSRQIEMTDYEYSSLIDIHKWSEIPSSKSMFDSILVFENYPVSTLTQNSTSEIQIILPEVDESTNYPITLVAGLNERLLLRIVFDKSKYTLNTIRRVLNHLKNLIIEFIDKGEVGLNKIQIMSGQEINQIVEGFNNCRLDVNYNQTIKTVFEKQVTISPNKTAVRFYEKELTYFELNSAANKLANYLINKGIGPEQYVGICLNRSIEMIVSILGIIKTGAAYVPLDPLLPKERIHFMVRDTEMQFLITSSNFVDQFEFEGVEVVLTEVMDKLMENELEKNPAGEFFPENAAYVIYTSGSTGKPKGVLISHNGVINLSAIYEKDFSLDESSSILQFFSFGFDGSVADIFSALLSGAELQIINREDAYPGENLRNILEKNNINMILMPPSALKVLPNSGLNNLKTVLSGGENFTPEIFHRWGKRDKVINAYGPTESTVIATRYRLTEKDINRKIIPIGKPVYNQQVYILDKYLNPVPIGVEGEIFIAGIGLSRGYLNQPSLTAEKFIPNPFSQKPGERIYRTGDVGRYLEDGNIEFVGRTDFQVKVRGFRIELGEIESVLSQYPAIKDVVVNAIKLNGGENFLVCYFIPQQKGEIKISELKKYLSGTLPLYMIPSFFVEMDEFPVNSSGKIDRKKLPVPGEENLVEKIEIIKPRNKIESEIADIWKDLLNRKNISVVENFFEAGGHSLLAIRLLGILQEKFNANLTLVDIFKGPTIEEIAINIQDKDQSKQKSLLIKLKEGKTQKPLFFLHPSGGSVHWYTNLANQINGDRAFFGVQARGIDGKSELDDDIQIMAKRYMIEIIKSQPEGPYYLGGWSFGVIVAYEVAQQLISSGKEVALLALLDQGPFLSGQFPNDDTELIAEIFKSNFTLDVDELRSMDYKDQLRVVLKKAKKAKMVPFWVNIDQFGFYIRILKTMRLAWKNYQIKSYPGRISLFRAVDNTDNTGLEPDLGWSKFSASKVEVIEVPGDHISMMQEPNVKVLAEKINQLLNERS